MTSPPVGRRERKKAATRQALADAALRLFLERGYDAVSIRDVAEAADVSTTTLFKHFSGKEALVFDEDSAREATLVAVVRDRAPGRSIPAALRDHLLAVRQRFAGEPAFAEFERLIAGTPALRDYADRMWMRHRVALAAAIAAEVGAPEDDPASHALAHFALQALSLTRDVDDPARALREAFALLENGWGSR